MSASVQGEITYVNDVVGRFFRELTESQQVVDLDHGLFRCLGGFLLGSLFLQVNPSKFFA
jgi:hypothetical protein